MSWRLAESLKTLREQVNDAWPTRDKKSDGSIGDPNHQSTKSDHNPWVGAPTDPTVTAIDITHDPDSGADMRQLAKAIIESKDPRLKYMILMGRILAGEGGPAPWEWRDYNGANPHDHHIHISVVSSPKTRYDNPRDWQIKPKRFFQFVLVDDGVVVRESLKFEENVEEFQRLKVFLATTDEAILRRLQQDGDVTLRRRRVTT